MKLFKLAIALAAGLVLAACTTTFQVAELDPQTKRFKGASVLPPDAIKTSAPFNTDIANQLLFLRTNVDNLENVSSYFEQSIEKYGYFKNVMRKDEFERFLIANNLQDKVGDVSGFASLSKAAGIMGDFLFADIDLSAVGYDVTAKFAVYNARDAREVFRVEYKYFNWAGLDGPLFQPIMNAFFDWIERDSKKGLVAPPPNVLTPEPQPKPKK